MSPSWLTKPIITPSKQWDQHARARQKRLTKPPGSLGLLEEIAVRLAALQRVAAPTVKRVRIVVFAADHGVAAGGVSAYPQAVTVEMIRNFSRGGAAISVLARHLGATLEVVDVGALTDPSALPGVVSNRAGNGTADFRDGPAMTPDQYTMALSAGREAVERAAAAATQLFIGGDMGIGNTTAATAIVCALLGSPPSDVAGPGTGLDRHGVQHKAAVVAVALQTHQGALNDPQSVLMALGGFEIVALTGAFIHAGQREIPVLVDGFTASAAALAAVRIQPGLHPWLFFAHCSAEPGHRGILEALSAKPLLDLAMRLGEGSGAAVAVPLVRLACALHAEMATFEEAGVSTA